MAQLVLDLPDAAVAHARECAKLVNQPSLEAWILEWLVNSVKQIEKQKKQTDLNRMGAKMDAQVDALYQDGTVPNTPLIDIPKDTTLKVV